VKYGTRIVLCASFKVPGRVAATECGFITPSRAALPARSGWARISASRRSGDASRTAATIARCSAATSANGAAGLGERIASSMGWVTLDV
jgi:hypothetical protein